MTREEYLQLVQESEAFKEMDSELQQKILTAEGADMAKYAEIFTDERALIYSAKKELLESNEEVLRNLVADMKKFTRDYLKTTESLDHKNDEQGADALLNSI